MEKNLLNETKILNLIKIYLYNKEKANWHEEKSKETKLHQHGPDLILVGGKLNSERFIIECKGKSYSKSADSVNKEGWLNALGQIVTRMDASRIIQKGKTKGRINTAYKYGLGLYWVGAQVALKRIPKNIAKTLNLYIFAVNDNEEVIEFSPAKFGRFYSNKDFNQ